MILDALIPLLTAPGIASEGVDLFLHFMPASVVSGVLLLPTLAGTAIDPQAPRFRNRDNFQAICRDGNVDAALARAARVFDALIITQRTLLPAIPGRSPAVLVNHIRPRHDPLPYPRQPSGGWEVSINFTCSYVAQEGTL